MGAELKGHRITIISELTTRVRLVYGNRRQLQEVIVSLVRNAMEAMENTTDRNRVLRVKTEHRSTDAIVLFVQDSGPGIDPKNLESIFDAFVTNEIERNGIGACYFPHDRRATWRPAYCVVGWQKRLPVDPPLRNKTDRNSVDASIRLRSRLSKGFSGFYLFDVCVPRAFAWGNDALTHMLARRAWVAVHIPGFLQCEPTLDRDDSKRLCRLFRIGILRPNNLTTSG